MRIAALAMVVAAAACAGLPEKPGGETGGPLAATLEVEVTPWSVRFLYHVTNGGDEPLPLTFPTAQRYDIVVATPTGDEVWRWSDGRTFQQVILKAVLEPGDTWELTGIWDFGSRTGPFVATGLLLADGGPLVQSTPFEVP